MIKKKIFDTKALGDDLHKYLRRHRMSMRKATNRMGLPMGLIPNIRAGKSKQISVYSLAKICHFMGQTDIEKYIIEEE